MALLFDRIRVQNKLVELALAGSFYAVSYAAGVASADTSAPVAPDSAIANEISSRFNPAEMNRRTLTRDRSEWLFQLKLGFNREVVCEAFENSLRDAPPKLARDATNGLTKQVTLELRDADYKHPVQQEGVGTFVTYTFEARLTPN